jgi:molybdopterin-guanine dinucleotide biosynthesis protein A
MNLEKQISNIPCIILSGGKSSRMGKDKSLLPFGKFDTLVEYQYQKLSKIFQKVYISTKTNKFNFEADLILDNITIISSPMVALQSILKEIKTQKVFIITVDTPFIKKETISKLIKQSSNFDITIAQDKNKTHNLCGVFSKNILPMIDDLIINDIHKINFLIKKTHSIYISFDDTKQFLNINTSCDYQMAINHKVI